MSAATMMKGKLMKSLFRGKAGGVPRTPGPRGQGQGGGGGVGPEDNNSDIEADRLTR